MEREFEFREWLAKEKKYSPRVIKDIVCRFKRADKILSYDNKKQDYPVFTYIATSIGESLDVYRFDIEDNDLKEAVAKYNFYRKEDKNNLRDLIKTHIESDPKLKLIDIKEFDKDKSWIIENFWSEEEKIDIGLKKAKKIVTVDEFQMLLDDMISLMNEFKEELEWLK